MPDISERQELMASRLRWRVAVLGAGYLGLNPPGFAAGTVALAFGLAAVLTFPSALLGIFSKAGDSRGCHSWHAGGHWCDAGLCLSAQRASCSFRAPVSLVIAAQLVLWHRAECFGVVGAW